MKRAALMLSVTCSVAFVSCREPAPSTEKVVDGKELPQTKALNVDASRPEPSANAPPSKPVNPTPEADAAQRAGARPVRMWPYGPPACVQCQQLHCTKYFDVDPFDACSDSRCRDVVRCELDSDCFTDLGNIPQCYCGAGIDLITCQQSSFVPTGACRELIERGLESTDRAAVHSRFVDAKYPAGIANQLATCIADLCSAPCIP
jgi:hypothetical protein